MKKTRKKIDEFNGSVESAMSEIDNAMLPGIPEPQMLDKLVAPGIFDDNEAIRKEAERCEREREEKERLEQAKKEKELANKEAELEQKERELEESKDLNERIKKLGKEIRLIYDVVYSDEELPLYERLFENGYQLDEVRKELGDIRDRNMPIKVLGFDVKDKCKYEKEVVRQKLAINRKYIDLKQQFQTFEGLKREFEGVDSRSVERELVNKVKEINEVNKKLKKEIDKRNQIQEKYFAELNAKYF